MTATTIVQDYLSAIPYLPAITLTVLCVALLMIIYGLIINQKGGST